MSITEYGWRHRARCDEDSALLFIVDARETRSQRVAREDRARAVCDECVVKAECLDYALSVGETEGIWGGLTGAERAARQVEERRERSA